MKFLEIKRGISRVVFLVGPWAVKVPTTRPYGARADRLWAWTRGYQANYSELRWKGTQGVCPVLWHLGNILVCYRRARPVAEHEVPAQDDPWWNTVAPILPFADRKASNLGRVDGALVWVDFDSSWNGCPHDRWIYADALGWSYGNT